MHVNGSFLDKLSCYFGVGLCPIDFYLGAQLKYSEILYSKPEQMKPFIPSLSFWISPEGVLQISGTILRF